MAHTCAPDLCQYEEDAAIAHCEFDLKVVDRVKMKMVGIPVAAFEHWAAKVSTLVTIALLTC